MLISIKASFLSQYIFNSVEILLYGVPEGGKINGCKKVDFCEISQHCMILHIFCEILQNQDLKKTTLLTMSLPGLHTNDHL